MDLTYPQWQEPLAAAILEFNSRQLGEKIHKAEEAIANRIKELEFAQDNRHERLALSDGLSILRDVKRDRLGTVEEKSEYMERFKRSGSKFVVEDSSDEKLTVELDADFNRRPAVNHFRTTSLHFTHHSSADYEYRIDGTSVFCRLIEDWHNEPGVPQYQNVRDGVVLESAIRGRNNAAWREWFHGFNVDDEINPVRKEVKWHEMEAVSWHGLKYFILAKKLPQPDALRYLRQELERLQTGAAAFFKEAEKYGLERDDNSRLIDRLRVAEGKTQPPDHEIQKLFASAENFGITDLEFSWERKLTRVLEKLLAE